MILAYVRTQREFGRFRIFEKFGRPDPTYFRELFRIGWPIGASFGIESSLFMITVMMMGWVGTAALAAHQVAIQCAAFTFMVPLGISQGAATRVGNLIGARDPEGAQRAAWVSFGLGAGFMAVAALGFVAFRAWLPRLYTPDVEVVAACAAILPIAAAFQVFDGTQVVGCGVLRGMGRTRPAMLFNFVSYWVLGLPIAWWLGLSRGWGLAGVWWGLALGLGVVATLLLLFVRTRGPAFHQPTVPEGGWT